MPAPSRNEIYQAVIKKMVTQTLEEQETRFENQHGADTDEQLLAYLKESAIKLQHSPRYKEIVGWQLIERKFGTWNDALRRAGLPTVGKYPVTHLPRYQEEIKRQKECYRQKKVEKKQRSIEKRIK